MLDISGEKVDALVKNIDYDPLSKKILALVSRLWLLVKW